MTWFKVDDSFAFHPKAVNLPPSAGWLWVRAGAWCAQNLTDGRFPLGMIAALGGTEDDAHALVDVGLWKPTEDGYEFHDWLDYQPSRAKVEADRRATKSRQQAWRARNGVTNTVTNGVTDAVTDGVTNAAPTRPDPKDLTSSVAAAPKQRKTKMPAGWWPTDEMATWARQKLGPAADLRDLTENFIDHHAAKGNTFVDWNRAWQTWVRNDKRFHGAARDQVAPNHIWEAS